MVASQFFSRKKNEVYTVWSDGGERKSKGVQLLERGVHTLRCQSFNIDFVVKMPSPELEILLSVF